MTMKVTIDKQDFSAKIWANRAGRLNTLDQAEKLLQDIVTDEYTVYRGGHHVAIIRDGERVAMITTGDEMFANHFGYSDVDPFEIVRRVSDKTIEIREMDAARDESVKMEFVVGGFAGHCINQDEQKWFITSNPLKPVIRIRLGKGGWKDKHGRRFGLSDKPKRFYDYNF